MKRCTCSIFMRVSNYEMNNILKTANVAYCCLPLIINSIVGLNLADSKRAAYPIEQQLLKMDLTWPKGPGVYWGHE